MTELEQYKRAYATLAERVDTSIDKLNKSAALLKLEETTLLFAAQDLADALLEAEGQFLGDGEA